jgi:mRNA interferase HigB
LTQCSHYGNIKLRVISKRALREFREAHPASASPLAVWYSAIKHASLENPGELRAIFGSVDFVGKLVVFNVGGNKFRLIAGVDYQCQVVYVNHILTHKMYDEGTWKA